MIFNGSGKGKKGRARIDYTKGTQVGLDIEGTRGLAPLYNKK